MSLRLVKLPDKYASHVYIFVIKRASLILSTSNIHCIYFFWSPFLNNSKLIPSFLPPWRRLNYEYALCQNLQANTRFAVPKLINTCKQPLQHYPKIKVLVASVLHISILPKMKTMSKPSAGHKTVNIVHPLPPRWHS